MKLIQISGGTDGPHFMKVDDEDFIWMSRYHFSCLELKRKDGSIQKRYAKRREGDKTILAHREIMNRICPLLPGQEIDHKNHIGLDNQRSNMRVATHSQNLGYSRKYVKSSSTYKGVSWAKRAGKWIACIQKNGKTANLGFFETEVEAAKAYDEAAQEIYGEFALLNFVEFELLPG